MLIKEEEQIDFWDFLREFAERIFLVPAPPVGHLAVVIHTVLYVLVDHWFKIRVLRLLSYMFVLLLSDNRPKFFLYFNRYIVDTV